MSKKTQKKIRRPQDLYNPINKKFYVTDEKNVNKIFEQIKEAYKKNEITNKKYNKYMKSIIRKKRKIYYTKKK